mgnify:CR=1 FL=1
MASLANGVLEQNMMEEPLRRYAEARRGQPYGVDGPIEPDRPLVEGTTFDTDPLQDRLFREASLGSTDFGVGYLVNSRATDWRSGYYAGVFWQLYAATGASKFTDPKNFPWTMGFNPNYFVEGRIYGQYIIKNHPNAKIGILYQNDDFGRDFLGPFKKVLEDAGGNAKVIMEQTYDLTEPTIDSQIINLSKSGADVFYNISTGKASSQSIRKVVELGRALRKALDEARAKLDAIANIERSISDRPPATEGRTQ